YAMPDGNGGYDYVYQYRDHLGNIRLSYTDGNGNGSIDPNTEIVEESNYYPFGLTHKGYNNVTSSYGNSVAQKWKFGGKEYEDGLNESIATYDFGARNYDPALGRWMNLDPLAEQMRRHSPYNYAFDNPVFFIDPDGMAPINFDDPIYDNRGNLIGDDGKTDGKIHVVYNNSQARDIKRETDGGNKEIDLTGKDVVTLNGGEATVNGVVTSVDAQGQDTGRDPSGSDAGLHEEGGHTERDSEGNVSIVAWEPGPKKSETGNGSINLFNGIDRSDYPSSDELADYWHVHTSKTQEVEQADGSVRTYRGSMTPSGSPGSAGGDIGTAQDVENSGYSATAIQVGTSSGTKVNFYNSNGVITRMRYRDFKKLKN
ncbi:RHS repeat-associated core domain-containing protein, partial [Flagellimonas taeanensis]